MKENTRTKGLKKLINTFMGVLYEPKFQKLIKQIRVKHQIKLSEETSHPICLCNASKEFHNDLRDFLEKTGFRGAEWEECLYGYIQFNKIENSWFDNYGFENDVCAIYDTREEEVFDKIYSKKELDKCFPITLRISPYASINDIYSYLKRFRHYLEETQKKHKKNDIKIGKFRKSKTRAINYFILENSSLPRKEISQLVKARFNYKVDEIYARNIIAREKKKRKQV